MDKARWFYPDTNYIYGGFKKDAQELKTKLKPKKKFKAHIREEMQILVEKGVRFVISELTEFEIKHALMADEGLLFRQANRIFQDRVKDCPIYNKMTCLKEVRITNNVINWALEHKLDLSDALHILIATRLSLFIITKEKKGRFERWAEAYDSVLSPKEFQELVRKLPKI